MLILCVCFRLTNLQGLGGEDRVGWTGGHRPCGQSSLLHPCCPGSCSPQANGGSEQSTCVSPTCTHYPGREIIEEFRDLGPFLARDQGEMLGIASDSPALLTTNPSGVLKLCQRMKLKYLKYNPHTSSKAGGEMAEFL